MNNLQLGCTGVNVILQRNNFEIRYNMEAEKHIHEELHEHEESPRKKIALILMAAVLLGIDVFIEKRFALETWQLLLIYLIPYLLVGFDTLKEAAEGALEETCSMKISL